MVLHDPNDMTPQLMNQSHNGNIQQTRELKKKQKRDWNKKAILVLKSASPLFFFILDEKLSHPYKLKKNN